jgi:hypothetical protein
MRDDAARGHNGGPPLEDEHVPEWGRGGIGNYFSWKAAHRKAYRGVSPAIMMLRAARAERIGLTYEEYTLELLERARHLQASDVAQIERIKRARRGGGKAELVPHRRVER